MLLYEHEGKTLFREFGIPTLDFVTAADAAKLDEVLSSVPPPVIVKAQVLTGGRGKAGGIIAADSHEAARDAAVRLLQSTVKGLRVDRVLIEPQAHIEREFYLAVTIDGEELKMLVGSQGGMDIESYFSAQRSTVETIRIDPLFGLSEYQLRNALDYLGVVPAVWSAFARIALDMFRLFQSCDAKLAEINPLALTADGNFVALDARVEVDEGALFRQPRMAEIQRRRGTGEAFEARLKELDIQYVPIGGAIGLVSQGAGAGVTIMDWVALEGARISAFVDMDYAILSGKMEEALRFILGAFADNKAIRAIIVNFTTCGIRLDFIAVSLIKVLRELRARLRQPIFIHLQGNRGEIAHALMREAGYELCEKLGDAVRGACRAAEADAAQ